MARKITLALLGAGVLMVHGWLGMILLAVLVAVSVSAPAANSSKAYATEARTASLETRVGNLEQGLFPNVQNSGFSVTLFGSGTLHVGPLSLFTSQPNTSFLAGLSKMGHIPGVGLDPFSGPYWGSGERSNYINDLRQNWANFIPELINNGYMSP